MMYYSWHDSSDEFTNLQKASYWKGEARDAIQRRDFSKLWKAYSELWSLRIKTANEAISLELADLKKF